MRKAAAVSLLAIGLALSFAPALLSVVPVAGAASVCSASVATAPTTVSFSSGQTKTIVYTFSSFTGFASGDTITITASTPSGGWAWTITSGASTTYTSQTSITADLQVTAPSTVSTTSVVLSISDNNCGIAGNAGTTLASASTTLSAPEFGSIVAVAAIGIFALALFRRGSGRQTNTTSTPI